MPILNHDIDNIANALHNRNNTPRATGTFIEQPQDPAYWEVEEEPDRQEPQPQQPQVTAVRYAGIAQPLQYGNAGTFQDYYRGDEPTNDTLANDDNTNIGNWLPKELKNLKGKLKEVALDSTTVAVIKEISAEIISDCLETLKEIYKIRVDSIEGLEYNALIDSVETDSDRKVYSNFESAISGFQNLISGEMINSNGYQKWYLGRLEEIALNRYHIDYSKYKYYPRLKSQVKYGNPELLEKILSVTQIGKGFVTCKQQ